MTSEQFSLDEQLHALPPLTGSDEQIARATARRDRFLSEVGEWSARWPARQAAVAEAAMIRSIAQRTSAQWWLDIHDMHPGTYAGLNGAVRDAVRGLARQAADRPMLFLDTALFGWRPRWPAGVKSSTTDPTPVLSNRDSKSGSTRNRPSSSQSSRPMSGGRPYGSPRRCAGWSRRPACRQSASSR